ncbi:MAG: TlpA disulfide reductase family protein [Chitinophagales bacterium]|nr:TlpA disulfide reductase family protein [Chitinophagales bacterium]
MELITFKELSQRFDKQSDTTYVYNFWATWCKPCIEELPYFEQLNSDYASKNVRVVLVSVDFKSQLKKVQDFRAKKSLKSEVVLLNAPDYNSWINQVSPDWQGSIPATYVVSTDGRRTFHEGPFTYAELESFIQPLIKP